MIAREELRRTLDGVLDLERLLSRVTLESANARDLLALAESLAKIAAPIRSALANAGFCVCRSWMRCWMFWSDVRERIEKTIVAEPPMSLADGGVVAAGLDRGTRRAEGNLIRNGKQYWQYGGTRARTDGHRHR